jgi:hypothetical protein
MDDLSKYIKYTISEISCLLVLSRDLSLKKQLTLTNKLTFKKEC